MRRSLVPVLFVLTGLLVLVGGLATWMEATVYDSRAFSRRATSILDSPSVRSEVANLFTAELVKAGNQQAISYRPAFEAAIEAVLDTDTFRAIFRNSIRTVHADVLRGASGSSGINLSDSISIIASTLQLPSDARGEPVQQGGFSTAFADTTQRLADLGIWRAEGLVRWLGIGCLAGAVATATAAIVLARDRRRAVWWLGWVLVTVGIFVVAALWVVQWFAGRRISDPELSAAVAGGLSDVTVDLRTLALWVVGYGVVIAGAAAAADQLYTPAIVGRRIGRWLDARRQTTTGTLLVGVLGVLLGFLVIYNLAAVSIIVAVVAGLWLTYLGTAELLRLIGRVTQEAGTARRSWWRPVVVIATVLVLLGGLTAGVIWSTSRSAADAAGSTPSGCNGSDTLCDRRLDEVLFAGTHNSMSSALYPGWLFGEQVGTIADQLNSGVRALLFDTHYGIPSSARLPGSQTPLVLTDRARELSNPEFEGADAGVVERANTLAARAPRSADADSTLYLCHNYCELGAVSFASVLADIKDFVDTHPDDVVLIVIQDATTADDTGQAFVDAGLSEQVATLELGQPLPTLQELIDAGTTLVVWAEDGGAQTGPPWYQPAYEGWLQETPFSYDSVEAFDCASNRGGTTGELFLVNHWVTTRGPDPGVARRANSDDVVRGRIERCIQERGALVNIIATDFAQASEVVDLVAFLNETLPELLEDGDEDAGPTSTQPSTTSSTTSSTTTTTPGTTTTLDVADLEEVTTVTSLTGGDPGRFCATIDDALLAATAYAEAILSEPPDAVGLSDLAFAPLLVRTLTPYVDTAPIELAELATPLRDRATAAVSGLDRLGFDESERAALADQAYAALSSGTPVDGPTLQGQLLDTIRRTVAEQDLDDVATATAEASADPATILDFGYVPPDVADASGFNC